MTILDEASKGTESESKSSDSTPNTTVDKNTDSRHESSALLQQVILKESSAEERSVSKENKDKHPSNSAEKKQEFAVPVTPSSQNRTNRKPKKVVKTEDRNETVKIEENETCNMPPEYGESQQGRKRNVSEGETDIQQEQNIAGQENVSQDFYLKFLTTSVSVHCLYSHSWAI